MRSRLTILVFMLLLCTCASTQQYHYNLKFRLSPKNFADTISIEVENGRIYLPVTIDGETYRFLLDTGASMGGIYAGSSIQGIETVGTIASHDATGQSRSTDVVRLPDLQIGCLTISGYHANRLLPPPTSRLQPRPEGVIGFDIFRKGLLCKIDVENRRLILTDRKNHFRQEQGYETRYRLHRHIPFVTLSPFEGYSHEARFDTGDRSLYAISKQDYGKVERGRWNVEGQTVGSLRISHFGAESTDTVTALCIDSLRWGNFTFQNVHTLTAQGPSAIGSAILDYGSVIINPRRSRLIFQPYDSGSQCIVDNHLPDIYYIPNAQGLPTVGLVWENSEPYRQGFRQGDVILQIDNTPINSVGEYIRYPFIANQTYTITVRDKRGETRLIKLSK